MTKTLASTPQVTGPFDQNLGRIAEYGVRPLAWLGQILELLDWNLKASASIYTLRSFHISTGYESKI